MKLTRNNRPSKVLRSVVAFVCFWLVIVSVPAQQSEFPLFVSLSAATPRKSTRDNNSEVRFPGMLTERDLRQTVISDKSVTDAEAWERFEAEYSPQQKSLSPVKREIESAKYSLDTLVFAIDHCAKTIENYVDFSFPEGGIRPTREMSSESSQNNPRVKLDLNIGEENKPCYAGVRVIIPFGN